MLTIDHLLSGIVLPLAVAAVVTLLSWQLTKRRMSAQQSRSWGAPLALGSGFVAGYLALFGRPDFPPAEVSEWLLLVTPLLVAIGLVDALVDTALPWRIFAVILAVALTMWLLVRPTVVAGFALYDSTPLAFTIIVLLVVGWIAAMEPLARQVNPARWNLILLAAIGPASLVLMLSGSQRLGQTGALLAAVQAGCLLANLFLGTSGTARPTISMMGISYAGVLLCGTVYASLWAPLAALLFAAPLAAWLPKLVPAQYANTRAVLQVNLVLWTACAALVWAHLEFAATQAEMAY